MPETPSPLITTYPERLPPDQEVTARLNQGVLVVFQSLPTLDVDNHPAIGGNGTTFVSGKIKDLFDADATLIHAGQVIRDTFHQLGIQRGDLEPDDTFTDKHLNMLREKYRGDTTVDRQVDERICNQVRDTFLAAGEPTFVLLEAKLAGRLIKDNETQVFRGMQPPLIIFVSIDSADNEATYYFLKRQIEKQEGITFETLDEFDAYLNSHDRIKLLTEAAHTRKARAVNEKLAYNQAYGLDYSRDKILAMSTIVYTNHRGDTAPIPSGHALEQLAGQIACLIPHLQDYPNLAGPVLHLMTCADPDNLPPQLFDSNDPH
jgi:hypothetical protein